MLFKSNEMMMYISYYDDLRFLAFCALIVVW